MKLVYLGGKHGSVVGNYAQVDDEDYELVSQYNWYARKTPNVTYAIRKHRESEGTVHRNIMHRFIMSVIDPKIFVDHVNGNGLDNQRSNLRLCTLSQNCMNIQRAPKGTSKYLGVHKLKHENSWRVDIRAEGKKKTIGQFKDEKRAALAYNEAAIKYHGEFAKLNIIE